MKTILQVLFICTLITSCNGQTSKYIKTITPIEFQKKVNAKKMQILDVRTPEEFAAGHIKNAVNKNWYDTDFLTQMATLDKKKPVCVYCKAGGRSSKAAAKLAEMGFTEIYNLDGGITSWTTENLPLIK